MATLTKAARAKIIENFDAIDYILFDQPASKLQESCSLDTLNEYITTKAALLNSLTDLYKLVEYTPSEGVPINKEIYTENIQEIVKECKKSASSLIKNEKSIAEIKEAVSYMLKENNNLNSEQLSEVAAQAKCFSLALDELLIKRALYESRNVEKLNEGFPGKIFIDSYQFLRDDLVSLAMIARRMSNVG